jgi:hypothetical protein
VDRLLGAGHLAQSVADDGHGQLLRRRLVRRPFTSGGFAVGIVARANPRAALLGYFFGPRQRAIPSLDDVTDLKASEAVLVGRFGHLGLTRGRWPIIGQLEGWDRRDWPMPVFVRYEELTGRSIRVIYDADDPAKMMQEEEILPGADEQQPKEGLMGAGYLEKALTSLLG